MTVLLVLFYVVLFLILNHIFNTRKKSKLPPLADGAMPIIGHAWMGFIKKDRLYEEMSKTLLGSTFCKSVTMARINIVTWNIYVCMDPDDGYLLVNSNLKKDIVFNFFRDWMGETGLIISDAPTWKRHRKLLNPTFSQSFVDSYLVEFNEKARGLVERLTQEAGKGPFNHMLYMKETILQITCATLMGVSVSEDISLIEKYGKACDLYASCMAERIRKFYFHSDFLFNLSNLKRKQNVAAKTLHDVTHEVIRKRRAKLFIEDDKQDNDKHSVKARYKSLLDLLLAMENNGALTDTEIQHEVHTFIGSAYDTTFHTLGMILLSIGSYPDVQKKIFNELHEVFEGSTRDAEKQDISRLKYLDAVIKETMRLYPVVMSVGRILERELEFSEYDIFSNIENYTLPAGSRCYMSIYHLGRHQVWGPDAEQFRPERWLDGSLPTNPKAFAVFGLGKRACIGSHYGMTSMKTILSHIIRRFQISGDITQLEQYYDVIASPARGHHISIQQREKSEINHTT